MFGFLNVYKPKGMTSHDVVSVIRRATKIKQVGHTGTLDPFATGVLPICVGKATRLIEYLEDDKEYIATVQFGMETTTYDLEGEIVRTYNKKLAKSDIVLALKDFEGEIEQLPPIYSAIKVNGKKLYDYARQGQEVEIKPRKVVISKIELLDFNEELQQARIIIACSKGTYIRSVAYDLGRNLDCGGYLIALERIKAGSFAVANSISLDTIKNSEDISSLLINPIDILSFPKYQLNDVEKDRVLHGMCIYPKEKLFSDVVILLYSDKMYAVGKFDENKILVKKVFEVI